MRTDCIVKLSKLQISELNTLVQKETSGDVEGKPPPSDSIGTRFQAQTSAPSRCREHVDAPGRRAFRGILENPSAARSLGRLTKSKYHNTSPSSRVSALSRHHVFFCKLESFSWCSSQAGSTALRQLNHYVIVFHLMRSESNSPASRHVPHQNHICKQLTTRSQHGITMRKQSADIVIFPTGPRRDNVFVSPICGLAGLGRSHTVRSSTSTNSVRYRFVRSE
jgi:hypothetical protein